MEKYEQFIKSKGISLEKLGANGYAFTKDDILCLLQILKTSSIPVSGGDVLIVENEKFKYTYDNWYCNPKDMESLREYANRSITIAEEYILKYPKKGAYFSLVIST